MSDLIMVCIAGDEEFNDYELLKRVCDSPLQKYDNILIVSSGLEGTSQFGEKYASDNKLSMLRIPMNVSKYGNEAESVRNDELIKHSDLFIIFWDKKSSSTKRLIDLVRNSNKSIIIIEYKSLK